MSEYQFAKHIQSGVPCAIKFVDKKYLAEKDEDGLYENLMLNELNTLK